MKKKLVWSVGGLIVSVIIIHTLLAFKVFATNQPYKVICHHTPSNQVTLSFQNLQSYLGHLGIPHSGSTYDTNGACTTPSVTPSPTVTPTVTQTPSITPTPTIRICDEEYDNDEGKCLEPTITPTIGATPTAQPTDPCLGKGNDENGHPCGWSPETVKVNYEPPVCTVGLPSKPTFNFNRTSPTTVDITWNSDNTNVTGWTLSWGYDKDNLSYGNGGKLPKESRSFTIGGLSPNVNTWVELSAWNGDQCRSLSDRIDP